MLSIGFDIGSSSVKAALLDGATGEQIADVTYPESELEIQSPQPGWAEQSPDTWWECVCAASKKLLQKSGIASENIACIGISYQMHGLVLTNKQQQALRPAIIWCDSRAVKIGNQAALQLGADYCQQHLLNSPGNFTASKLRWVKEQEPETFDAIESFMLPGDYIAMRMTGVAATTVSGLSEGVFWDFKNRTISTELLNYYGIPDTLIPEITPTFGIQGKVTARAAIELGLHEGTVVSYRAGDQPNNALSLGVFNPGEAATTAGTSGVIYGVTDVIRSDAQSRVNLFAHVNYQTELPRLGILLCLNGTGILNSWLRRNVASGMNYQEMNDAAMQPPIGADNLYSLPFGNGAERILNNRILGAHLLDIDLNRHTTAHILRSAQEGIVFAMRYGFEIMKEMNFSPKVIRAGVGNMFLSELFAKTFVNATGAELGLYNTNGAYGAARAALFGAGHYTSLHEAFHGMKPIKQYGPDSDLLAKTEEAYATWKTKLEMLLQNIES